MTLLGTYPEPRLEAPGVPFAALQKFPPEDLNQIIDNERAMWTAVEREGSLANMQAVSDAVVDTVTGRFHVVGVGWYIYTATTRTDFAPVYYAATGMSSTGSWELEEWRTLYRSANAFATVGDFSMVTTATINFTIASATYVTINDGTTGSGHELQALVGPPPQANDRLLINVTPLAVLVSSGDTVDLRLRVTQNSVSKVYFLQATDTAPWAIPTYPQIRYVSNGADPIQITLEARNVAGKSSAIASTDMITGWGGIPSGTASFEWCNGMLVRQIA
jgi:hypothetical protein